MKPVVVSARQGCGKAWVVVRIGKHAQSPGGKQHRDVNAFRIHRLELDFAGPTTSRVITVNALFLFVVVSSVWGAASAQSGRIGIRKYQAQVADILGCSAAWSVEAELRRDITLPQIGRLHDMHVAVEDSESVFRRGYAISFRQRHRTVLLDLRVMRSTTACQASTTCLPRHHARPPTLNAPHKAWTVILRAVANSRLRRGSQRLNRRCRRRKLYWHPQGVWRSRKSCEDTQLANCH